MTEAGLSSSHTELNRAQDALGQVSATLAVAQGLAASGRRVQLDGLEAAAGIVCARILDLPPSQGAALRPALAELQSKVAALTDTLKLHPK